MGDTSISWTDKTWNPIRGCSRVSEGCRNCYAERQGNRFRGPGQAFEGLVVWQAGPRWTGEVRFVAEHLADPLRWRKPQRVFVNSMSDLFHERLTNEQIAAVFGVMAAAPQHTFQVLTKRAKRMREWFEWMSIEAGRSRDAAVVHYEDTRDMEVRLCVAWLDTHHVDRGHVTYPTWPLPNVWLGVSVENQDAADERIPELLRTPAAVRFLSCEPLLGPTNLRHLDDDAKGGQWCQVDALTGEQTDMGRPCPPVGQRIAWVIAGCESGPGARPCDVAWLRSLRDQCAAAGVPYFLKQATYYSEPEATTGTVCFGSGSREKAGGVIELPYLDGVQHAAFPEVSQ